MVKGTQYAQRSHTVVFSMCPRYQIAGNLSQDIHGTPAIPDCVAWPI